MTTKEGQYSEDNFRRKVCEDC